VGSSIDINVVHVASGDLWGGAESQLFTLIDQLKDKVTVSVVLMNHGELERRLLENGVTTYVLDEKTNSTFKIILSLVRIFKLIKPNLIHSHRQKENILATAANVLSVQAISVRTQHGAAEFNYSVLQIHKHVQRFADWLCGRFFQKCVISVSSVLTETLNRSFSAGHVITIENGVDVDKVCLAAEATVLNEFPSSHYHIGIVGRLVPVKRVDIFIETAKKLYYEANLSKPLLFHIFGGGPLKGLLEDQVKRLGMTSEILFHGHRDDILACIRGLDVLLMCSDHEGLPMTAIEAMALETPVVSHNIGGLKLFFQAHKGGVLSEKHSAESYFNEIFKLLEDLKSYEVVCKSGLEVVKTELSAQRNAHNVIHLYEELVKHGAMQ
jgi:glycosyltransferase involved in cell wall biosynthesis